MRAGASPEDLEALELRQVSLINRALDQAWELVDGLIGAPGFLRLASMSDNGPSLAR